METIKTVFEVRGETYAVRGFGQSAASIITERFPVTRIVLLGFMINEEFVPANFEE